MSEPKKRARVDWDAVERDYRTGKFTLRELGEKHGCTHGAVVKMVKKHGWTQDLTKAVRAATNARLIQEAVSNEVAKGTQAVTNAVLAAAEVNARVIRRHQERAAKVHGDLELATAKVLAMAETVADVREAGALMSAIEAGARTLKTLVEIERKAHGLDAKEGEDAPDEDDADRLRSLDKADRAALLEVIRKARGG
jgi:hypothetical protein